jgi:hypothetical protein
MATKQAPIKQTQQTQQQQQLAKQKAAEAEAEKIKEYIAKWAYHPLFQSSYPHLLPLKHPLF